MINHRRRVLLNKRCQVARFKSERPAEWMDIVPKPRCATSAPQPNAPQPMRLWAGVVLIAVLDGCTKSGLYNSQLLKVMSWDPDSVTLQCTEGGREHRVTREWLAINTRPGWAVTYASIQARTCHGTVALHDATSAKFSRRHLVMGLSRATAAHKAWIA